MCIFLYQAHNVGIFLLLTLFSILVPIALLILVLVVLVLMLMFVLLLVFLFLFLKRKIRFEELCSRVENVHSYLASIGFTANAGLGGNRR